MANITPYRIPLGDTTYPAIYDSFLTWLQSYLTELEGGRVGQVDLATKIGLLSPVASPSFTGTPAAPTAALATNTTQLATTAFVAATLAAAVGGTGLLSLSISNASSVALANGQHDATTYAGVCTWTLPAAPAAGHTVAVTPANGRADAVIARNGNPIMSLAENLTLDNNNTTITLRYINSTVGWRII